VALLVASDFMAGKVKSISPKQLEEKTLDHLYSTTQMHTKLSILKTNKPCMRAPVVLDDCVIMLCVADVSNTFNFLWLGAVLSSLDE
jgi:hypothetical protein